MTAGEVYDWLIGSLASPVSLCPEASQSGAGGWQADAFDRHVVAAILALAMAEGKGTGGGLLAGTGLRKTELIRLLQALFPATVLEFESFVHEVPLEVDDEERSIRDVLNMYCSQGDQLEQHMVVMIARRCKSPHHLWQDLGLRDRGELSALMRRHFAPLANKNRQDMKWKKFLYRMVCSSEGFTLCTAPVCAECDDFSVCFGAEDGESRLAQMRNSAPRGPSISMALPAMTMQPAG